jgi:GNAT superfamily N-acetyltransferase
MIKYQYNLDNITPSMLEGFFAEWGSIFPSKEKHFAILKNSTYVVLAVDDKLNRVVGFINAISDKILSVYIPLLEVLPAYKIKGIGQELVKRLMEQIRDFYMIDLTCDEKHNSFYERFGMRKYNHVMIRNHDKRGGV